MRKMYPLNFKKSGLNMNEKADKGCNMGPDDKTLYFLMMFARSVHPLQSENPEADYLSIN